METAKIRDGAYGNFVTGMGRRDTDKTENTFVNPYAGTDIVELARIKVQDGIAARIVDGVPLQYGTAPSRCISGKIKNIFHQITRRKNLPEALFLVHAVFGSAVEMKRA